MKQVLTVKQLKKQKEAISGLVCMLDELSNKPRRLFSALEEFAEAFLVDDCQLKLKDSIIDDIDQWEDDYYKNIGNGFTLEMIARHSRDVKKELKSREHTASHYMRNEDYIDGYKSGVEDTTTKLTKKIIDEIVDEIY